MLNGVQVNLLPTFILHDAQPTIGAVRVVYAGQSFVTRAHRQLVYPYLLLNSRVLSHGVDLVLVGPLLFMRNCAELLLLAPLVDRVEGLVHSRMTCMAGIHVTRVALLEMAGTHFDLCLLRWVRISLPDCHVYLLIILLIAGLVLGLGQTSASRRLQVTVVQVPAVEAALGARTVRCVSVVVDLEIEVRDLDCAFLIH